MKYTLQIAFSEPIGDIILRVHEYAKKFGNSISHCINPLLFKFTKEGINVQRPEKNYPYDNIIIRAIEIYNNIPIKWEAKNNSILFPEEKDIEDFFEHEFSNHIIEEDNVDSEMHIIFYVPLYESKIYYHVKSILENLPKEHKFVSDIIAITYDMAWSCNILKENIDKEQRRHNMLQNINELVKLTRFRLDRCNIILNHIFLFQNYNITGWSQKFTTKKFIETCGNLSLALVEYYDQICPLSWQQFDFGENNTQQERPILTINLKSEIIDSYLAINSIFRTLFKETAQKHIINVNNIDKIKVKEAYKDIIYEEIKYISEFKNSLCSGLKKQSTYEEVFNKEVKEKLKVIITEIVNKFNLNISEQQSLYSSFSTISNNTNFEDDCFYDINWYLEEKLLKELESDQSLLKKFNDLKKCSLELKDIQATISEQEKIIQELQTKINKEYPTNGELTEEGYKIGNEIFKPYIYQDYPLNENYKMPINQNIPVSVDLRSEFSNIKNQGSQGACSAFSLVSVIEYFLHKILHKGTDLSEAFVYYNARLIKNETDLDKGASFSDIIQSIKDYGVCLEQLCPYNPNVYNKVPSDEAYHEAKNRKITEAQNIKLDIKDIKSALAQGLPIIISTRVSSTFVSDCEGFVPLPDPNELKNNTSNHAMVICGYTDKEKFFIVRNSWGLEFGDHGYCYLPYEYIRTPNAINNAYVVTGLNIKGFHADELPTIDSLLRGKNYNAQYVIYKNILYETNKELIYNRKHLDELHKEYLSLFNQFTDYSKIELTLQELKEQSEQQRTILEEKLKQITKEIENKNSFIDFFKWRKNKNYYINQKEQIEEQIENLSHYADEEKRKFRIRMTIINGLTNINKELIAESINIKNLSSFYEEEIRLINDIEKDEIEDYKKIKQILPIDSILNKLKVTNIMSMISSLSNILSQLQKEEDGSYDNTDDLFCQILKRISYEFNIKITDYMDNLIFEDFYKQINHSTIMAQIYGGVPQGYGNEIKFFLCNINHLPQYIKKETEGVILLPIKDNLRMSFLHIEKYDIKDLLIFRTDEDNNNIDIR